MAKKRKSKKVTGLWGLVSIAFGASMFGLAFIPYEVSSSVLGDYSRNLYNLLSGLFKNGFGEATGTILTQIGALLYFLAAIYAVVVGVLMTLQLLKGEKLDALGYGLGFVGSLLVLIGFIVWKNALIITFVNYYTLAYIPLIVITLVMGYKAYKLMKR